MIGDINEIEKIQNRAAKLVIKLKNKPYTDRLLYLNLPTLKHRRIGGDMIDIFKINHNIYYTALSPDLSFNERANTRGNRYKPHNHNFIMTYENIFSLHVLSISATACLIQLLILALLTHLKARLYKFWQHRAVKFDLTADLTGTGN